MSQITSRINLSARTFPLVAQNWGRTVMVSQSPDNNFNRQVQSTQDSDHDVGIPQVYYCHNVMPHAQGFQSVGYETILNAAATVPNTTFSYILDLQDDFGRFALLAICTDGSWYTWESSLLGWQLQFVSTAPTARVYATYISGITYVLQKNYKLCTYNWTTHGFDNQVFTALDISAVDGITSSFGYMIAWNGTNPGYTFAVTSTSGSADLSAITIGTIIPRAGDAVTIANFPAGTTISSVNYTTGVVTLSNVATATGATSLVKATSPGAVYWSSTISELDFTPSLITGSGGGEIQAADGPITFCLPHTKGFIVYTTDNAVGGTYSGNAQYPFDFQAIVGSGGISNFDQITQEGDTGNHYAYTTNGMQLISMGSATTTLTDVTDFISGKLFEDFDDINKIFTLTRLSATLVKKICIVSSRYLIISYGILSLTHALVYDLITQRFGKLKVNHVNVFEVSPQIVSSTITDLPRQSIGLLQANGTCVSVSFDVLNPASNGTLILGKYQYVRARTLILDEIFIENVYNEVTFNLNVMTSLDGKTYSSIRAPYLANSAGGQSQYKCREEGINHSLLLQGQFHIESGVLSYSIGGKR
jgi:hypothetical protein